MDLLKHRRRELEAQTQKLLSQHEKSLAQEKALRRDLREVKDRAGELKSELVTLTGEIQSQKELRDELEQELAARQEELDQVKTEVVELKRQRVQMDQQMGALTEEILKQEEMNGQLKTDAQRLEGQVTELVEAVDEHQRTLLHARVLFSEGQVLDTHVIGASERGKALVDRLLDRLSLLNQQLLETGAKYEEGKALLYYQPQIQSLIEGLTKGKAYVVKVVSATNVFKGQPVVARFEVVEDRLVFRRGEVIVSRRVDPLAGEAGGLSKAAAEGLLQEMLLQGRQVALEKGMQAGPNGVGQVRASQLVRAADAIMKRAKGSVEVSLVAEEDTFRGSLLSVDFRIKDLGSGPR